MKAQIAELLKAKGQEVISIDQDATVYDAIEMMESERVGSVIAMSGGRVSGIFTERDYLRRIVLKGRTSKSTLLREAMTSDLVSVPSTASVQDCMQLMTQHRIRHLPVMDDGEIVGVMSIGDMVKHVSEEAQAHARHLEGFVKGAYPG